MSSALFLPAAGLLLTLASAPAGDDEVEVEVLRGDPVSSLTIAIPTPPGPAAFGTKLLLRGMREAVGKEVAALVPSDVIDERLFAMGFDQVVVPPAALAEAGRAVRADYVLSVELIREGWLYTARATLVKAATAEVQMDFRSGFYKPETEATDRGIRIGRKAIEKLRFLLSQPIAERPPPPRRVETSTRTAPAEGVPEDTPLPAEPGVEADPFGGSEGFAALDTLPAPEEFEGFEAAGWRWEVRGQIGASYYGLLHPDPGVDLSGDRSFVKVGARNAVTGYLGDAVRIRLVSLLEASVIDAGLHRVVLEEGFVEWTLIPFELRIGWDALTWGAASTFNIVDVINARDFSEGFIDAPKLGQPMAAVRLIFGNHSLTAFYLTPFVPPRLPGVGSIFNPLRNTAAPYDLQLPRDYGGRGREWHPQAALRLELSFSGFDLRSFYFYGYERFPLFDLVNGRTFFPLIHQAGIDGQLIAGQTTFKWEVSGVLHPATRRSELLGFALPDKRLIATLGVEQAIEDLWGTTLIPVLEVFGTSDSVWFTDERPPDDLFQFFQNHGVIGFRWLFENGVGSELVALDLIDLSEPGDHFLRAWYSERWFENFTFRLELRWVIAEDRHKLAFLRNLSGVFTTVQLNY